MEIHNQTGTLEKPLTTLADQLSDTGRKTLEETVEKITTQAGLNRRMRWWIEDHPIQSLLGALAFGAVLTAGAVAILRRSDYL